MKKSLMIMSLLLCSVFMITGCGNSESTGANSGETPKNEKLTLSDDSLYYDEEEGRYYVEGVVTNNTDESFKSIEIVFKAYDSDNNHKGQCSTYLTSDKTLEVHGTWNVKAPCSNNDIDHYEFIQFNQLKNGERTEIK